MNDSLNVFPTPVDSLRVAAQDITSEQVTQTLNLWESVQAMLHLLNFEFAVFVMLSYYIVVTRIPFIKTNSVGKRNLTIALLTIIWGLFEVFVRHVPWLNILVTGLSMNAFYEYAFKWFFTVVLAKLGVKLPSAYVDEVQEEKRNDIAKLEEVRKP